MRALRRKGGTNYGGSSRASLTTLWENGYLREALTISCILRKKKKGGVPTTKKRCDKFMDRINDCSLLDCGAIRPKYTWRGPVFHGGDRIFEWLNRALQTITGVLWYFSPFADFQVIKEWKNISIEKVNIKKREILARIGVIQRKVQGERNNIFLVQLEAKLQKELAHILKVEELMWYQRSRARWLVDGDRNTRYYHLKTITRRRHNKISMLRDMNGGWVEEVDVLKQMANNISFPRLSDDEVQQISVEIDEEEIK
ncbi:hypothetical protein TSUD_59250 [Trifolium subterraneum]|uniref:Uncharacterized protein n=1 Tax=Trifolium subterraneum TaxID=3900 RepID=A0A2Z6MG70_TRISU|nr:hypothetical protein TSUD_59250 [Trifolium subterraneum]